MISVIQAVLAAAMAPVAVSLPDGVASTIAEVRSRASAGDSIWPGYGSAPFGFLLVQESGEVLLCDDRVPAGFAKAEPLAGLDCPVATGPSSWRKPFLLAAMPVFGPGEVIVMGTPEATGLKPADWRRTILHEHFHQWQATLPGYQQRIDALALAGDDQNGMWMINYAFPYKRDDVVKAHRAAADALLAALAAPNREVKRKAAKYWRLRGQFERTVSADQWRYFDFQLWKEGVARWSEIAIARRFGGDWASDAEAAWARTLKELTTSDLAKEERVAVYAFGAGEAALLERVRPGWRECYRQTVRLGDCWKTRT